MAGLSELEGGNVRASDRDRAAVVAELRMHCLQGRITVDELERRVERAMSSVTIHELALTVVDMPEAGVAAEQTHHPRPGPVGPPGIRPFTQRIVVPARVERVRAIALDTIAPALNGFGYELRRQSPWELQFERSTKPGGLVGLLANEKPDRIVIALEIMGPSETTMIIHGRASRRVRKAFAALTFS